MGGQPLLLCSQFMVCAGVDLPPGQREPAKVVAVTLLFAYIGGDAGSVSEGQERKVKHG